MTAGTNYIQFFFFFKYHLLNTLQIKHGINQQDLKIINLHFIKYDFFHPLEVVDRASETQLQVGESLYMGI